MEIETTSNKLYNKFVIDVLRMVKFIGSGIHVLREDIQEEFEDYNYNLLTHPNFEIITNDIKKYLTKEQLEIEVLGNLFFD